MGLEASRNSGPKIYTLISLSSKAERGGDSISSFCG